jgi:hypothetical protein
MDRRHDRLKDIPHEQAKRPSIVDVNHAFLQYLNNICSSIIAEELLEVLILCIPLPLAASPGGSFLHF